MIIFIPANHFQTMDKGLLTQKFLEEGLEGYVEYMVSL